MADQKDEPVGVGGCLGFFVIGLIVIGPLLGWVSTSTGLKDSEAAFPQLVGTSAWGQYKLISWVTFFTQAILSIHAGIRLNSETKPGAVRYAIFILWFSTIGINTLFFLALFTIPEYGAATAQAYTRDPAFVGQILGQAIAAGVWTVYLLTSRRVRNTYYAGQWPTSAPAPDPNPTQDREAVSANAAQIAPAPEAPTVGQSQQPNSAPDEQFVLYDERFDWLAMYLIALVPLWLGYSFKVGLILFPAFALIAALKPMRLRLGSLTWSGIFAAGACLLLSPMLLIAAIDGGSDLIDDITVRDQLLNRIRAFVFPMLGISIMMNAWFRAPRFKDANGLIPKRMRLGRWLGFAAAGLALVVSLLLPSKNMDAFETDAAEDAVAIEDRSEILSDDERFDSALDAALDALEAQMKLERSQVQSHKDPLGTLTPPISPITSPTQSIQPLPSSMLSATELRELAASGWRDGYPDGDGCMIERIADDGLNSVLIYEGYSFPVIELSFSLDVDGPQWSPAELQTLAVQIDDHRIPARVQGVSKVPAEVEIPYTDMNRTRIARARLIALHLGPVQLARTAISPNSTSTKVIEACLRSRER